MWYEGHFYICVWGYIQSHWKSKFYGECFMGHIKPCKDEFWINLNLLESCAQQRAGADSRSSPLPTRTGTTSGRESSSNAKRSSSPFPGQRKYVWPKSRLHSILSKVLHQRKLCLLYLLTSETYEMYHHNLNSRLSGQSLDCAWHVKDLLKEQGHEAREDGWSVWHWHSCVIDASRIPSVENLPWQITTASCK